MGDKIKTILSIALGIVVVALVGVLVFTNINHKKDIEEYEVQLAELQEQVDSLGDLQTVYLASADLTPGQEIKETDFYTLDVPEAMTTGLVTDLEEILGKYYRIEIPTDTPMCMAMVIDTPLEPSSRYLDVVTDENALGLKVGDYVDIRVSLPLGEDMPAMSHKRVVEINSNILKLEVDEWDIQVYSGILNDRIMYPGTRLYAIEYISPGTQEAAETFYLPPKNILATAAKDPNNKMEITAEMVAERAALDVSLSESLNKEIAKTLSNGKASITDLMKSANAEIYKQWAADAKAAAKEEGKNSNSIATFE